jgi:hypothetical protein
MNNVYRPSAAVALFVTAALVACHGVGGYNPPVSQEPSAESSLQQVAPSAVVCKAAQVGRGTALIYAGAGNVKGTTFKAIPGALTAGWVLWKLGKGPTPKPSSTPKAKLVPFYVYYGTFAMKNKQTGCASLATPVSGKPIKSLKLVCTCNGVADGVTKLKAGFSLAKLVARGLVSSLVISHLSAKGGSGSVTLVTATKKPYTTGTITLIGRIVIKMPEDQGVTDNLLQDR